MSVEDTVRIVAIIGSAGWTVIVWSIARLTKAIKLKAEVEVEHARLAAETERYKRERMTTEFDLLRERMESTLAAAEFWERSLDEMRDKLKDADARLAARSVECEALHSSLVELRRAFEHARDSRDPLADLLAREHQFDSVARASNSHRYGHG